MNETSPVETMYSAEKSPIIASARDEVTFDSKNSLREALSINHRLSLVLSMKNHPGDMWKPQSELRLLIVEDNVLWPRI